MAKRGIMGKKPGDKFGQKSIDGDKAWARLRAQTNPLDSAKRNRHTAADMSDAPNEPKKTARKIAKSKIKPSSETAPETQTKIAPKAGLPKAPAKKSAEKTLAEKTSAKKTLPPLETIEQKARRRLSRGHMLIDGRLDLHGLTAAEAQAALRGFILHAVAQNHIWLLVITGKGTRGEGVLRRSLPDWLAAPELARHVVAFAPSAPAHGGGGAFYLRLRKARPLTE